MYWALFSSVGYNFSWLIIILLLLLYYYIIVIIIIIIIIIIISISIIINDFKMFCFGMTLDDMRLDKSPAGCDICWDF